MMKPGSIAYGAACCALLAGEAAGLPPTVRVVRAGAPNGGDGRTWATAFSSLQAALDAAAGSRGGVTEIWVAAGTYTPTMRTLPADPRSATFRLMDDLAIYGGFAGSEQSRSQRNPVFHTTVLSGEIPSSLGVHHVVTGSGTGPSSVLDGFTVRGGDAVSTGVFDGGGGILVQGGGPTLSQLIITSNAAHNGGGAYIDGPATLAGCAFVSNSVLAGGNGIGAWLGGGVQATDCVFTGHSGSATSGGGAYGAGTFVRCSFIGNRADAGGGFAGTGTFIGCSFISNRADGGGGVLTDAQGGAFTDCIFMGNRSDFSGGGAVLGGGSFVNCLIRDNTAATLAGHGIAVSAFSGPATLINCTVTGHASNQTSPALGGALIVTNSILWNNGTGQAAQVSGGSINYSTIQGWTGSLGGVGNSGADPMLTPSCRLPPGSPAVDAGSNAALPAGTTRDLDGNCRIVDGDRSGGAAVDMGAYEFQVCYPNCDCRTDEPVLNVADFICFLNRYSAGDAYANCDGSTDEPVLNVADFICYQSRFAQGCT